MPAARLDATRDRVARLLGEADVLVSPRLKGLNTPMKIYSYLDSGTAVLATRLRTHTQVLDDRTAYLVDPVSEARLTRPDTGFVTPTDVETVIMGRLNSVYGRNVMPANAPRNTIGYIVE